jgi:hypothetical protein
MIITVLHSVNGIVLEHKIDVGNVSAKQSYALGYFASGATISAVADATGVSRGAVYGWMRQPEFAAALDRVRAVLFQLGYSRADLRDARIGTAGELLNTSAIAHP